MTASATPLRVDSLRLPGHHHSDARPYSERGVKSLLERHLESLRPRMTAVAQGVVRNTDAAQDVVQNAFEKAVRGLPGFDGRARLSTWVHRIVVNEGLMWLRSEGRRRKRFANESESGVDPELYGDPEADPSRALFDREELERLRSGLAALPSAEREVLEHCALAGQSYDDYARELGIGAAAAKSRAFRARRRLRDLLRPPESRPISLRESSSF